MLPRSAPVVARSAPVVAQLVVLCTLACVTPAKRLENQQRTDFDKEEEARQGAELANASDRLRGCASGDPAACAGYCNTSFYWRAYELEGELGIDADAACHRGCEGGDDGACLKVAEATYSTNPAEAYRMFGDSCARGSLAGCWRLMSYFGTSADHPVSVDHVRKTLAMGCDAGEVAPCFLRAMNELAETGDVERARGYVAPVVARSREEVDYFGARYLLECLDGKYEGPNGLALKELERQASCITAETVVSTNFPYAKLYPQPVGELAALPWAKSAWVDISALPSGSGWHWCSVAPKPGYTGDFRMFVERTAEACNTRIRQYQVTENHEYKYAALEYRSVYCITHPPIEGYSYSCYANHQECAKANGGDYNTCIRWGDNLTGAKR